MNANATKTQYDLSVELEDVESLLARLRGTKPTQATLYYRNHDDIFPGYHRMECMLYSVGRVKNWHESDGVVVVVAFMSGRKGRKLRYCWFGQGEDLVILAGWNHPEFTNWKESRHGDATIKTPVFDPNSPEWELAYDRFISSRRIHVLVDCRHLHLGRASSLGPPRSAARAVFSVHNEAGTTESEGPAEELFIEGDHVTVELDKYERDPKARLACIQHFGTHCQICSFDFGAFYPGIGRGFIEVHHLTPLSSGEGERLVDPKTDLLPVCSNCHSMLHKRRPPYTPDELKAVIRKKGASPEMSRMRQPLPEEDLPF